MSLFKIVDNHVEPFKALVNEIGALLSTGEYFENEDDAWYYLSVIKKKSVEDLKLEWNKEWTANIHINSTTINEAVAAEEEYEDSPQWETDILERLDGLLPIKNKDVQFAESKFIYYYDDSNTLIKHKMPIDYHTYHDAFPTLKECLQLTSGNELPWTELADSEIEKLELIILDAISTPAEEHSVIAESNEYKSPEGFNNTIQVEPVQLAIDFEAQAETAPVTNQMQMKFEEPIHEEEPMYDEIVESQPEVLPSRKYVYVEDIRGKEVYFENSDGKMMKGTILSFVTQFLENSEDTRTTDTQIEIGTGQCIRTNKQVYSKEEFIALMTSRIDAL